MQRRRHGDESRREHRGDGKSFQGRGNKLREEEEEEEGKTGRLMGSRIDGCEVSSDWKREEEDEIMRRGR